MPRKDKQKTGLKKELELSEKADESENYARLEVPENKKLEVVGIKGISKKPKKTEEKKSNS